MRRLMTIGLFLALPFTASASMQSPRATFETITIAGTAVGLASSTRAGMSACSARLETAPVRYRYDGVAPTAAVGSPVDVGDVVAISIQDAAELKFIRTTSTSGVLSVSCWSQ